MTKKLLAGAMLVGVLFVASCGSDGSSIFKANENDGAGDAPIARVEKDGWVIYNAPDHYGNIAFRCAGPNGIYEPRTTDSATSRNLVVVANDENCKTSAK